MITFQRVGAIAAVLLGLAGCADEVKPTTAVLPSGAELVEQGEWTPMFDQHKVVGTFALHELGSDRVLVHDSDRAATPAIPASTFKILNSLIALETGAVTDVDEMVPWDGVNRSIEAWNQDHSLRTGIQVSAVWAYQQLAREIGEAQMASFVSAAEYGNGDIGGPIDEFWLRGELRITPLEQLDMLAALMADELPFAADHQAAVREILVRESGDGWVWGHKTGTALAGDPVLGWLVGYTEFNGSTWVFAMNLDLGEGLDVDSQIDPKVRQQLSRAVLEHAGALPPADQ